MSEWPDWWDWELELSPHVLKRMRERDFTETDLRGMLHEAVGLDTDVLPGRWRASSRFRRRQWIVVLEPDHAEQRLVVVTAFPVDE